LRQRLVGLFGKNFNERLVPVSEDTSIVNISGFIGKPEYARKTRGEQYFFVNRRFIKDGYLHHAVSKAFAENLPAGTFPSYFLFLEIDPKHIDINIHPTKTEIKFDDERSIYSILRAAVTTSLGKFSISPSLDFEKDPNLELSVTDLKKPVVEPGITINKEYNPFNVTSGGSAPSKKAHQQEWKKLYEALPEVETDANTEQTELDIEKTENEIDEINLIQLKDGFVMECTPSAFVIYNQQLAHQRVLYEKNLALHKKQDKTIQQELFPVTYECNSKDAILLSEILSDLNDIGFDIRTFGKNAFIIHGIPNYLKTNQAVSIIESIVDQYKNNAGKEHISPYEQICKVAALVAAVKPTTPLSKLQVQQLVSDLKACKNPNLSPFGKPTFYSLSISEIENHFNRKL
ncbi:MAG: DNA mismatch repair endonuclease MutL, partial [Bacteroidia bacterium]|nr:DNA mismatch repair endonuclease MutL [Bacteroidia bacterium]